MPHHFSFSGCGFLGVYHLGVSACLKQHVPDLLEDCKIAGASAGSFVACCLITGCSIDKCTSYVLDLINQAESQPILGPLHPRFKLISGLQESMRQVLPADAYKLASGRLFISLTRYKDLKNVIVSEYDSNNELIDALLCSGFVPFYCGIIPPRYKGDYYWDGGLSDNQPVFEEPTITVSPFSGETDICPLDNSSNFIHLNICNSSIQFTEENLHRVSIALFPPKSLTMSEICQQGYNDTLRYLQNNGMVNCIYHLNVPTMPNFQETETEDEELNMEENANPKAEEEPHFDCRECKHNIRKTLFSSLPPRLLKVFHSTMTYKNQGILKYIFQGKLFQAMSLMITPFIAPADILWVCFTSFLGKIPQGQQDLENILKQLSFLFLYFLDFLYKPCKHKQCMRPTEFMDSAYSYYCFNHNMDGAIQERIHRNKKNNPKDNDDSSNPIIIPPNSKVKVENLENHQEKPTLSDFRKLPSSCYCCHHTEAGQVTNCTANQYHLEIFPDSIENKLGKENISSVSNHQLKKSENMEVYKEQKKQTSLLNIEQDNTMANKRVFERSQSYPLCKDIYDKEIGSVPISPIQNKIRNMEAEKSQYLSKFTENCSSIDQIMFEKLAIDPLLFSQMKNFNETKLQNNGKTKQKKLMEAPKENNLYICEVNSITVNESIVDISAGEVLVDCEFDQEHGHTSDVSQATRSVSCEAHSLSNETVFVNYAKSQITPDSFNSLTESSRYLKEHENTLDISQTMSKSMEAHFDSFNNETIFVNHTKSQITHDIFNDLTESSSNLKEDGNTMDISQTMSKRIEAHLDSFNNQTVFVNCTKSQILPDERFLNEQSDRGFLKRSLSNPYVSSSEIKKHGHNSDISHMSWSLDTYLKYMTKETVFLNYEKHRIALDQGFLERSVSDQSEFNSNLKKHGHTLDTSRTTMSRSLDTHLECLNNETVFVNYKKHNITAEQNFLKRSLIDRFESNCDVKGFCTKFNTGLTNNTQTEQNSQPELFKYIENNCKTLNSEISLNYRTVHTPRTENYTKATVGILNDPDNLQTSEIISSMRESISTSSSQLVRHISIEHV